MGDGPQRILLVEDNPGDARLIRELLVDEIGRSAFDMQVAESLQDALEALGSPTAAPGVVFLDLSLPDSFGLETLYRLQGRAPALPVIVLTGNEDQQLALAAVKAGAQDYLVKSDLSGRLLVKIMKYARERKAIEASLRVSEARFRSLADLSSDWYWEQDAQARLAYLSEGFAEESGIDPHALLGRSWWDLARAGAEADWEALRAAQDAGRPFQDFMIRYPIDGAESLHLSISGVPMVADTGQTLYRGLGKDVSARERAAAALRGSEERFRRIMDTGRDGILMTDAEGRITFANRRVAAMLGYDEAELTGQPLAALVQDAALALPSPAPVADDAGAGVALRRRDGTALLTMQTTYPVHGKDGQHAGTLAIITDITEFKQREERVQQLAALAAQKSEAERASAAKSRFMAAVSHDLRQPMHALGLFLDDLKSTALPEQARPLVEHMESALHSTQSLLDAILVMSRLESGLIAPNLMAFSLQPLLERVRRAFLAVAHKKGLRLRVAGGHAVVYSDPALLERIVANLVSNALRYTDRGGVVLGCRQRGNALRIEVWDTGLGIAAQHQDAIFQEFFRVERAGENRGGLGLGLAIVRSCTQLLGYTVDLRSMPGQGSRFALQVPLGTLPAQPSEPDLMADDEGGPDTFAGLRVVLVDDDALILERTAKLLERWGCWVLTASSGPQAQALLAREAALPDLIISDLRLDQGELGTEVIQRLRTQLRPGLPALLLTGDTSLQTARDVRRSGLTLLYKPVPPAKLRIVMKNLLER